MSYSRLGYFAVKVETTEGVAVKPNTFVPLMSEDIVTEYGVKAVTPVAGNRSLNLRCVRQAIPAPTGNITIQVEPKTIGHFLRGAYGSVTTGRFLPVSNASGSYTVGETITGGTSSATATVTAFSSEKDYILTGAWTGTFAVAETVTGGSSGVTSTTGTGNTNVYGHQFTAPQTTLPSYTIEFGFQNEAYRYTGVKFNGITFNQVDNIITAQIAITACFEFKFARVTAVTSSGAGSKTITVDQTTGLATSDTVKIYRIGTGFLDFASGGVKTHTIGTIPGETSFTVTNLQTSTAVGDMVVIAPQTPSYVVDSEFTWIGGSEAKIGSDLETTVLTGTVDSIENFELSIMNEIEARHAADGVNVINRFPDTEFLKGLTGSGSITRTYTDMSYLNRLRQSTDSCLSIKNTGNTIVTNLPYQLHLRAPVVQFDPFNPSLEEDALLTQEIAFQMFYGSTDGYFGKALLVNDITVY